MRLKAYYDGAFQGTVFWLYIDGIPITLHRVRDDEAYQNPHYEEIINNLNDEKECEVTPHILKHLSWMLKTEEQIQKSKIDLAALRKLINKE